MAIEVVTYGKWILAGEHTVLRGGEALAFPIQTKYFNLSFAANNSGKLIVSSKKNIPHQKPFEHALQTALNLSARKIGELSGYIELESNIPLGSGLGGSASICVAIGKLFFELGWIEKEKLFDFCRDLENLFHGQSSGLDVATVLAGKGIRFQKNGDFAKINTNWHPNWYLSHSGIYSSTSDDVKKVNALFTVNAALANALDTRMKQAVKLALESLQKSETDGIKTLIDSMKLAESCFTEWQLMPSRMLDLALELKRQGALAVKPTGSGGGGYLLSLWPQGVKPEGEIDLLSVYA